MAHGSPRGAATRTYVVVAVILVALTVLAFGMVARHALPLAILLPLLLMLAVAQVALQALYWMHLDRGSRMFSMFFASGLAVAALVAVSLKILLVPNLGAPVVAAAPSAPSPAPSSPAATSAPASSSSTGGKAGSSPVALGQQIVLTTCISCHVVNGSGGKIGPDLNQVMAGKVNVVPGGQPTSAAWLSRWLANPQAVWSHATMPNLGLSPAQIKAVVAFLTTKLK